MKKKNLIACISPVLSFGALVGSFGVGYTVANFVESLSVDTSKESFIDNTTQNFICYPLVKDNQNDPDAVAIGWAKAPEECTGALNIPETVTKSSGGTTTTYYVTCIAESGFRYCGCSSVSFTNNNDRVEEIKSEAFYCCQNLTTFTMPKKCVNGIAPSTFMDCRNLTTVDMTTTNSYIDSQIENDDDFLDDHRFVIGDHAFTNCIVLKGFTFPANLVEINDSAFQKCKKIFGLFLPDYNGVFKITLAKYAFADCSDLSIFHMYRDSLQSIDLYCFAQCNNLRIYYSGDPDSDPTDIMNTFDPDFRKKHVAANLTTGRNDYSSNVDYVPIYPNIADITMDDDHPGFLYFDKNRDGDNPINYQSNSGYCNYPIVSNPGRYASIYEWTMPSDEISTPDWDKDTGMLTIPNTLGGLPVKAIEKRAFISKLSGTQKSRIKGVIFNNELVQIGDSAFEGCTKIATIDFGGNNSHIVEIGNKAFYCGENKAYTGSLVMPSTLLFIGQYAFANFLQAKSLTLNNGLLLIGKAAFENLGKSVNDGAYLGKLDLILPNTLRDGFVYRLHPDGGDYTYCQSVGEAAFRNCKLIRTVTMQEYNGGVDGNSTSNNDNRMISFGHKVFADCTNLLRFTGSRRMMCLGTAMFMNCKYLKEVFLSTAFASKVGIDSFVWGCNDNQSIFFEGSDEDVEDFKDTIVYVEGAQAPSRKTRQQQYYVWNSDPKTYQNEYVTSANTDLYVPHTSGKVDDFTIDHIYGRLVVPTYFNVTYYNSGVMKYYDLSTNTLGDSPTDNYENCIALLNKSGNYIVTKCYASNNNGSIDLTSINLNITTIGSCAFSTLSSGNTASKVILPRTVTTIRDRAFYSIGEDGINTITYKDQNGVEAVDTAQSPTTNICILPPSMTRIEDFAFYNNDFEKVVLPEDLSMIGNTAFTCSNGANSSIRSFEGLGNSSAFTYVNDGVYDKDTKTLLYYAANGTGTLDLSSEDILAIGPRALAATKYSSFVMPDNSISKIFGGAFANNKNVTQISGLEDLEYIGYVPDTPEMWDTSIDPNTYDWDANFTVFNLPAKDFAENFTYSWYQVNKSRNAGGNLGVYKGNFALRQHFYRWLASFGAFAYCSNLETFDFTPFISSLKKIGYGAFEGCSKLKNTTNGGSYTYYKYYEGLTQANIGDKITNNDSVLANNTTKITNGTGVVDLSNAKQLQCIEREAFRDCSLLKYFHLPILTEFDNSKTDQADFYLGFNYWDKGSWYDLATDKNKTKCLKGRPFEGTGVANGAILIGETARYANVFGDKYFQPQVKINVDLSTVDLNHPNNGYPGQTDDKIYKVDNYDEIAYNLQRYTPDFYPSTSTYFYISQDVNDFDTYNFSADTISSHLDDIKHWIYYGDPANHQYILFDTASQVKTYLGIQ